MGKTYDAVAAATRVHKNAFMHCVVRDIAGKELCVVLLPTRLIPPIVRNFLLKIPNGELSDWIGYVLYVCVPDALELCDAYDIDFGPDSGSDWRLDLYEKVLMSNPGLDYSYVMAASNGSAGSEVISLNSRRDRLRRASHK